MSKQVDWNNVISAVATAEGLLVTERGVSGQVGAPPYLVARGQATLPPFSVREVNDVLARKYNVPQPGSENVSAARPYRIVTCTWWAKSPSYDPSYDGPLTPDQLAKVNQPAQCKVTNTFNGPPNFFMPSATLDFGWNIVEMSCYRVEKGIGIPGNYTWEIVWTNCPLQGYDLKPSGP